MELWKLYHIADLIVTAEIKLLYVFEKYAKLKRDLYWNTAHMFGAM